MLLAASKLELGKASVVCTFSTGGAIRTIEVHLTINQVVICCRSHLSKISTHNVYENIEIAAMIVISQCNRPQIDIIRDTVGSVDNERSPRASSILAGIM